MLSFGLNIKEAKKKHPGIGDFYTELGTIKTTVKFNGDGQHMNVLLEEIKIKEVIPHPFAGREDFVGLGGLFNMPVNAGFIVYSTKCSHIARLEDGRLLYGSCSTGKYCFPQDTDTFTIIFRAPIWGYVTARMEASAPITINVKTGKQQFPDAFSHLRNA